MDKPLFIKGLEINELDENNNVTDYREVFINANYITSVKVLQEVFITEGNISSATLYTYGIKTINNEEFYINDLQFNLLVNKFSIKAF